MMRVNAYVCFRLYMKHIDYDLTSLYTLQYTRNELQMSTTVCHNTVLAKPLI